jgi:hypothetical protein
MQLVLLSELGDGVSTALIMQDINGRRLEAMNWEEYGRIKLWPIFR